MRVTAGLLKAKYRAAGDNILAVGFKDHAVVSEVPGSDNASQQAIEQIKKIFPDKPNTEMLVAYLPKEKLVFQGDWLNRPANGDVPIANAPTVHFAKWLESRKLAVERILAVHGPVSTMDELRAAEMAKENVKD